MENNENNARAQHPAAEGNNENKKPRHKHHHRRRSSDKPSDGSAEISGGDAITVRPGRYDVPPADAGSVEPVIIHDAKRDKPAEPGSGDAGNGEAHKSRRPRRRRGGSNRQREAQGGEQTAETSEAESAVEQEKPHDSNNKKKDNRPRREDESPETAEKSDAAPESAEGDAPADGEHKRRRRSRGSRRRGRDRQKQALDSILGEVSENADEEPSGTVSEYIATAGSTDAEIIDELNSISSADAENLEPAEPEPPVELATYEIVGVRFKAGGKVYYFDPAGLKLDKSDAVVVETARGAEFGTCEIANRIVTEREVVLPLRQVIRKATDEDIALHDANVKREKEAFVVCSQKIADHRLAMKLIDVEYTFDNSKLLFYFTAEGRVDFRELVKDLASVFRTRIELRQIGIRDETKLLGGIGICGRPFCCKTFLSDFVQVSIKMAKEQNLSLNSVKISGACGRLMCCLRYEYDTYQEEIRKTPKVDQIVSTPDGDGTVIEVQPLAGLVRVRFNDKNDIVPKVYHRDNVKVIGGKGVKPKDVVKEPPREIPADPSGADDKE